MTLSLHAEHIDRVVRDLQRRIEAPRLGPKITSSTVEAIDILHHALEFAHHPRALALWRAALWSQKLYPEGETALRDMLVYLLAAIDRGEMNAVSSICDCLDEIMPSTHQREITFARGGEA